MSRRSDRPVSFRGRPNRRARRLLRALRRIEVRPDTIMVHGPSGPGSMGCILLGPEVAQLGRDAWNRLGPRPPVLLGPEASRLLDEAGIRVVPSRLVPPGTMLLLGAPLAFDPPQRNTCPDDAFSVSIRPARAMCLITNIGSDLPSPPGPSAPPSGAYNG